MHTEAPAYAHEFNGFATGLWVSIKQTLLAVEWDVITIQQQSFNSTIYETWQPYLDELVAYIRKYAPKAKIYLQQTWGYKDGVANLGTYENGSAMFADVKPNYERAAKEICAEKIIRSGEVMEGLKEHISCDDIFRDAIHASFGLGRYALGLMWLKTLTGKSPYETGRIKLMEEVDDEKLEIAKKVVDGIEMRD